VSLAGQHGGAPRIVVGAILVATAWLAIAKESAVPARTGIAPAPTGPRAGSGPRSGRPKGAGEVAPPAAQRLAAVRVVAQRLRLLGTAITASQGVVSQTEIALLPAYRPAQLVETVPGLAATVHSGEGKASQYLMRGYNLDHGTDFAFYVDDMPINEPTHAHGQGYSDLNFLIPELVSGVAYTKGTYYADEGDFASVGSAHIAYADTVADQVKLSAGSEGFRRLFTAGSVSLGGGNLLAGLDLQHYDGPWASPDDQRKVDGVLRYSQGDAREGFSITGMFYHDLWNATTDQPYQAIAEGLIDRFGSLDPADGGEAQRASLSSEYHAGLAGGQLTANAYLISNHLTLWNDFTHYLVDPINGDQEEQHEARVTIGGDATYAWTDTLAGVRNDLLAGLHVRNDGIDVLRLPTENRVVLTAAQLAAVDYPSSFSEEDQVRLNSLAGYFQASTHWTGWLRSVIGLREDEMTGSDVGTNAGTAGATLAEPKASLIIRPLHNMELYVSWGRGFHSDDLRGVLQARRLGLSGAPLLARQTGEEVGIREQFARNLTATLALWKLDAQSELTYDPDIGQDAAGPASRRYGVELNVSYQATRWLEFYGDYSPAHARFDTPYDDGTGHVGKYLPNAPFAAGSLNIYVSHLARWSGGLALRYVGAYPLTADDAVQGHGYHEWNGQVSYQVAGGWNVGLYLDNILDEKADAAEFYYVYRLRSEPAGGVAGMTAHPLEPFGGRLEVTQYF
jgi:outer membrane receptor protein involved in Fe transport